MINSPIINRFASLLLAVLLTAFIFVVTLLLSGGNPQGLSVGFAFSLSVLAVIIFEWKKNEFIQAIIFKADRRRALHLTDVALREKNLHAAVPSFSQKNLLEKNLGGADLSDANLSGTDLSEKNLGGADLSSANLGGADLRSANLGGANLLFADLRSANLRSANLGGANLSGADLGGANLRGANLRGANLRVANLSDANLRGADLSGADLSDVDLRGADPENSTILGTIFANNPGISGPDKINMQKRGAIFQDSPDSDVSSFVKR